MIGSGDATELALFDRGRLGRHASSSPATRLAEPGALERSLARQLADELFDPETDAALSLVARGRSGAALPEVGEGNLPGLAQGSSRRRRRVFAAPTPTAVPAVGAALAAVREGVVRLNLLPEENREAFDEGAVDHDLGAARDERRPPARVGRERRS